MILISLLFFLSLLLVISVCFVVFLNNPIYSLLWLIISFVLSSFFLLILGCEFLALIFIVVYVGAIAVLFLFVVMLLDLKFNSLLNKTNYSLIITVVFLNVFLIFLLFLNLNIFKLLNKLSFKLSN